MAIAHTGRSIWNGCDFPQWMHYALIGYSFSFIMLFSNFYIHSYMKKAIQGKPAKEISERKEQ